MRERDPGPTRGRLFVIAPRAHRVTHGQPMVASGGTHVGAPGAGRSLCGQPNLNWATLWHLEVSDLAALGAVGCPRCAQLAREWFPTGGRMEGTQ
jgi:hypothetical protein